MYDVLYLISGLVFTASIVAYSIACVGLSQDIKSGKIRTKLETE
jgi:hypothetical protein